MLLSNRFRKYAGIPSYFYLDLEGKSWVKGDLPQLFPQLSIMSGFAGITYLANKNRSFPVAFGLASLFGLGSGYFLFPEWRKASGHKMKPYIPENVANIHQRYLAEYRKAMYEISDGWARAESSIKRIKFPKII